MFWIWCRNKINYRGLDLRWMFQWKEEWVGSHSLRFLTSEILFTGVGGGSLAEILPCFSFPFSLNSSVLFWCCHLELSWAQVVRRMRALIPWKPFPRNNLLNCLCVTGKVELSSALGEVILKFKRNYYSQLTKLRNCVWWIKERKHAVSHSTNLQSTSQPLSTIFLSGNILLIIH